MKMKNWELLKSELTYLLKKCSGNEMTERMSSKIRVTMIRVSGIGIEKDKEIKQKNRLFNWKN